MGRREPVILLAFAAALGGCAVNPATPVGVNANSVADRPAAAAVDVGIDWKWRIVGDRAVRPVQVFDLNGQTFLQMPAGRSAVLMVAGQVVPFQSSSPYLVVQGVPARIDVVRDGYRAVLVREAPAAEPAGSASVSAPPPRIERFDPATGDRAAPAASEASVPPGSPAVPSRVRRMKVD